MEPTTPPSTAPPVGDGGLLAAFWLFSALRLPVLDAAGVRDNRPLIFEEPESTADDDDGGREALLGRILNLEELDEMGLPTLSGTV